MAVATTATSRKSIIRKSIISGPKDDSIKNNNTINNKQLSYIELMRKFTKDREVKCKTSYSQEQFWRPEETMMTGSTYEGEWDDLGMSGHGTYTLPNGVTYKGVFEDGLFYGPVQLKYPTGETLKAQFHKGKVVERMLMFPDGIYYCEENWDYCRMPDRRFAIECNKGLQPSYLSYLTARQPTREVPKGMYDTEDGFYDPNSKTVYKEDLSTMIRSLSVREQKWTIENCRTDDISPGPRGDLYAEWLEPVDRALSASDIIMNNYSMSGWHMPSTDCIYTPPTSDDDESSSSETGVNF